jgi:chromosome segregation ATPase
MDAKLDVAFNAVLARMQRTEVEMSRLRQTIDSMRQTIDSMRQTIDSMRQTIEQTKYATVRSVHTQQVVNKRLEDRVEQLEDEMSLPSDFQRLLRDIRELRTKGVYSAVF